MTEHQRMIEILARNPEILRSALGLSYVFIRDKEVNIDPLSDEKADLIFQDKFDISCPPIDTRLFVLELKSEAGDHELLGQLKKAVDKFSRLGKSIKHWNEVIGITVAKDYVRSALSLLKNQNYKAFIWSESNGQVKLHDALSNKIIRIPIEK